MLEGGERAMFRYRDYVYTVYRHRSFSKAAEALHISQPALSATVKKAEKHLGFQIFDRSVVPLTLTDRGALYMDAIEQILDVEAHYMHEISSIEELKRGEVSFMTNHIYASRIFPEIIDAFNKRYPRVKINMFEGSIQHEEAKLSSGDVDFVVDNNNSPNGLFERTLLSTEVAYLCGRTEYLRTLIPEGYLLALSDVTDFRGNAAALPVSELYRLRDALFVLLTPDSDMRRRANSIFAEAGMDSNPTIQVEQMATAYLIAQHSQMLTFVSDILIKKVPCPALSFCIVDSKLSKRNIICSTKKNRYMPRAAKEFLAMTVEGFKRISPNPGGLAP